MENKNLFLSFFLLGALAVILGAFGAHGLADKIPASSLSSFKTGVQYQFIHVLYGIICIILFEKYKDRKFKLAAIFSLIGIFCFSGSLFILTTRELTNFGLMWLWGPMTPIGGLFFILAWLIAAIGIKNLKTQT